MGERGLAPVPPPDGSDRWGGDALSDFVAAIRPWGRIPAPLSPESTAVLWGITLVNVLAGGWAVIVLRNGWACTGFLCSLSTLGGRPMLLLSLTASCVLTMIVLAVPTGGLVRAGGGQLAALTLTSAVGVGAVLGTLLALVLIVLVVSATAVTLIALLDRS